MEVDLNSQVEELRSIIKELPYQEKSVVREKPVYYYSNINSYANLALGSFLIIIGMVGGIKGGSKGLYLSVLAIILGAWQVSIYLKHLGAKTPVVIITDAYIEYLGKTYEWQKISNAETFESTSIKGKRWSTFHVNFDYENKSISINISELNTAVASFLFQLYSHKLNYLTKYSGNYYSEPPQHEA